MSWTLCTSEAAIVKAGVNANSDIVASGARLQEWSEQIEGRICSETRRDWISGFASADAVVQGALADCASAGIAINIINYDMSGYSSRFEAFNMVNILRDIYQGGITILKDFKSNEISEP